MVRQSAYPVGCVCDVHILRLKPKYLSGADFWYKFYHRGHLLLDESGLLGLEDFWLAGVCSFKFRYAF